MTRHYSFFAPDRLEAALLTIAAQSSQNTARLRRELDDVIEARLEDVMEDLTSDLSVRPRRFPLTRWRGEITHGSSWSTPRQITVEVEGPPALSYSSRHKRGVSAAVTCLLEIAREHEEDLVRLRAKVRKQRQSAEIIGHRVDTLELPATLAAWDAQQQPTTSGASERTVIAVFAALAAVVLLEIALMTGLAQGGAVLTIAAGLVLAIALSVVIFFLVDRRPARWKPTVLALPPAPVTGAVPAPATTLVVDTAPPASRGPRIVPALLGVLAILAAIALGVILAPWIFRPHPTPPPDPTPVPAVVNPPVPVPTVTPTAAPTATPSGDPRPPARKAPPVPDSTDIW